MSDPRHTWNVMDRPNVRSGFVFERLNNVEKKLFLMIRSIKGAKSANMRDMEIIRDNALAVYNTLCECMGDDTE